MISAAERTHMSKKVTTSPESLLQLAAVFFVFPRAHIATNLPGKCLHSYFETRDSKVKTCPRGLNWRSWSSARLRLNLNASVCLYCRRQVRSEERRVGKEG